jgi:hypothetical protein
LHLPHPYLPRVFPEDEIWGGVAERDAIVTPGDKPFNRAINEGYTKYEENQ